MEYITTEHKRQVFLQEIINFQFENVDLLQYLDDTLTFSVITVSRNTLFIYLFEYIYFNLTVSMKEYLRLTLPKKQAQIIAYKAEN